MAVLGTPGFSTTYGEVLGVHVAWSGNSVLRVERDPATGTTIGGGELLLPGEVRLAPGRELHDAVGARRRSRRRARRAGRRAGTPTSARLAAHPADQPVVLNVLGGRLLRPRPRPAHAIADRAAPIGVERFVLDDGWFMERRDDTVGLGDWRVDPAVWPEGLSPLVEHVRGLGMQFGLWIEPEMVNPDSDLYREHPDWILSTGDRVPLLHRHQLVLDLSRDGGARARLRRRSARCSRRTRSTP